MPHNNDRKRFKSRRDWRKWLAANHATAQEIWLIFYKKHTREPGLSYEEAVEEALCFGWIDGILKRIDDRKHTIRFSPRRRNSIWSQQNKKRVHQLIEAGRMTEAGLVKVREAKANKQWEKAALREDATQVPPELAAALTENEKARRHFATLAPSYRKQFIYWVTSAKRDQTRQKRIAETVRLLALGKRPGMESEKTR